MPQYGEIPVFPALPLGFPVKLGIVMDTTVGTTKSLREMRVANQTYPTWDIELLFDELVDQTQNQTPYGPFSGYSEYQQLCQFFIMMYGQANVFAFQAPWDYSRSAQVIGSGDGSTTTFTAYRTWGSGITATVAPVGLIDVVSQVQVSGVATTSYTTARDAIVFTSAPANGAVIQLWFTYFYLCRFVADDQDFEEFSKNRWTVPNLKFRAVFWP